MSHENIQAFFEKAKTNPESQQKIAEIYAAAAQATAEGLAALSKESNVPFTAEEFLAAGRAAQDEISDETLAKMAGGFTWHVRPTPQ